MGSVLPLALACVGHASVDHHFEIEAFADHPTKTPASSYRMIVGGMAANASIAASRLCKPGERIRLLGRVGSDANGAFVRGQVAAFGVDTCLESVAGAVTSVSSVIVNSVGERQIFNHRGDALAHAHPLDVTQLEGAHALLVDPRWPDGATAALDWANRQGILSMLDADIAPRADLERLVPLARWVVFSENGLAAYAPGLAPEAALRRAFDAAGPDTASRGQRVAMVTLGPRGVLWLRGSDTAHGIPLHSMPAFAVTALDTTGAGDVFHAALALQLGAGVRQEQAIRFACAAAALKCARRYGVLETPTCADVEAFLAKAG